MAPTARCDDVNIALQLGVFVRRDKPLQISAITGLDRIEFYSGPLIRANDNIPGIIRFREQGAKRQVESLTNPLKQAERRFGFIIF
ncbi:MAG: hypothetical protein WDN29_13455 [Methylovirgula sp.]